MILKLRAALGNPTQQDTFLKIYLLQMNHHQHSLEVPRMWRQLLADLYPWIQEELLSELVCWKETLRIVQYRHQDLSRSVELGILPLTQNEFIFKVVRLNCPGIKFQTCISINSWHFLIPVLEDEVQDRSMPLFRESHSRDVVDQRSRGGQISGPSQDVAVIWRACVPVFLRVLDAKTASALKRIISKPFFNRRTQPGRAKSSNPG